MIIPDTFSTILVVGSVVKVIQEYSAPVGEFIHELSKQKSSQYATRSKAGSLKQIQEETELDKSLQTRVRSGTTFFMFRGIILPWLVSEITYWGGCREYIRRQGTAWNIMFMQDMVLQKKEEDIVSWVEKHVGAEHLCSVGNRDNCLVHCRPKAAPKEGSSVAPYVNTCISVETARNT